MGGEYQGVSGSVQFVVGTTTTALLEAVSFRAVSSADMLEVTAFSSAGVKEYISGNKDWTATVECLASTSQDPQTLIEVGDSAVFTGNLDGSRKISGTAYLKSMTVDCPQKDLVKYTFELQGTSTLSMTLTAT